MEKTLLLKQSESSIASNILPKTVTEFETSRILS